MASNFGVNLFNKSADLFTISLTAFILSLGPAYLKLVSKYRALYILHLRWHHCLIYCMLSVTMWWIIKPKLRNLQVVAYF